MYKTILLLLSLIFASQAIATTFPDVKTKDLVVTNTTTLNSSWSGFLRAVSGVVSPQALISLTADVSGVLPIANGGTNSSAALVNGRAMHSSGGAIVESLVTIDGSGNVGGINNLNVSGTTTLAAALSGPVKATAGVISTSAIDLSTAEVTGTLPIARGGTNSNTALVNGRLMKSTGGAIVESGVVIDASDNVAGVNNLGVLGDFTLSSATANRAAYFDASKILKSSVTTDTELGYLSGVTSLIQTQLDGKQSLLVNSAGLAAALNDETGTPGFAVFSISPTFTGDPQTPTATFGDNDGTIASTGFVQAAISALPTGGDVSGPASSVDSQIALFDGTTGKVIKVATGSGWIKTTSGVPSFNASVPGAEVSNTPAGNIAATTAQAAIDELDSEKGGLATSNTWTNTNDYTGRFQVTTTTNSSRPCPSMSTTERDALVGATNGDCINNTTTNSHQRYNGTAWENIGGGVTSGQVNGTWVYFSVATNNGQNCVATTATRIEWEDVFSDSHSAYNSATGEFDPPDGVAQCCFSSCIATEDSSDTAGESYILYLAKAGTVYRRLARNELSDDNSGGAATTCGSACVPVSNGDIFTVLGDGPQTSACTASQANNHWGAICFKPL